MDYGTDYGGGGGGAYSGGRESTGGGGGGGGFQNNSGGGSTGQSGGSSGGGGGRRNYDEQTLIPCTIRMIMDARLDDEGATRVFLPDGRGLHQVRLVAAVRETETYSTNIVLRVEDGTGGVLDVKQWVDENDNSYVQQMREKTCAASHVYLKIVGQVKDYQGKKMIVADSIRPLQTGNELAHHMLEVVYSAERFKRKNQYVAAQNPMGGMTNNNAGVGFGPTAGGGRGAPLQQRAGGGGGGDASSASSLSAALKEFFRNNGEATEIGCSIHDCIRAFKGDHSEQAVRSAVEDLCSEGLIYSTVRDDHYKYADQY